MTECILIKGYKQSLSCSVYVSLMLGCEVGCQNISTLTAPRPGWVTWNEVDGSLLPTSVSGRMTSFLPFICMRDRLHFIAQHNFVKDNRQSWPFFFSLKSETKMTAFFYSHDGTFKPVPCISSELIDNRLPSQEGKQSNQKSLSTSERQRFNQAPVKTVDDHGAESQAQGYRQ